MGSYAKKTVFWASSFQSSSERGLGPRSASFSLSIVGMLQGKIDIDRKSFVVDRVQNRKRKHLWPKQKGTNQKPKSAWSQRGPSPGRRDKTFSSDGTQKPIANAELL